MAARLDQELTDTWRSRIQTTMLLKRLNSFALGAPDEQTGEPVRMNEVQVRAALGLLKKTLPDLAMVEHRGSVTHHYVAEIPQPAKDANEWASQHTPATMQ